MADPQHHPALIGSKRTEPELMLMSHLSRQDQRTSFEHAGRRRVGHCQFDDDVGFILAVHVDAQRQDSPGVPIAVQIRLRVAGDWLHALASYETRYRR